MIIFVKYWQAKFLTMKNEPGHRADKIVEPLSESLKRQDQMVERLGNLEKGFSSLGKRQKEDNGRIVAAVNTLTDIMKAWSCPTGMEKTKGIDDLKDRVTRLEKHIGL